MQAQMKFIGMVLIVASCSGLGLQMAHLYSNRIRQCRQVEQCLQRLLGEIRFHQIPMEEALRETGRALGGEGFAAFLLRVSGRLAPAQENGGSRENEELQEDRELQHNRERQSNGEVTLAAVWREELEHYLEICLFQDEQELLFLLGRELGTLDLEEQVRSLQHCLDQWRQHIEGLQRKEESHGRLCRGVGMSVGVFLAILLL